ncbi:hypothetical protein WA026_008719 [Henosepilachna vigintioctopunctata]|uniref:Uncharacterized protein n=1 Tax=Henosepilachna vigintioctopunctata TaxID=420089 RepID=A0AAW1V4B1_9CUCU
MITGHLRVADCLEKSWNKCTLSCAHRNQFSTITVLTSLKSIAADVRVGAGGALSAKSFDAKSLQKASGGQLFGFLLIAAIHWFT